MGQSRLLAKESAETGEPSSQSGLPNETLRKIHDSAAKQAGVSTAPSAVGENLPNLIKMSPISDDHKNRIAAEREALRVMTCAAHWHNSEVPKRQADWFLAWLHQHRDSANNRWDAKYNALTQQLGKGVLAVILGIRGNGKTTLAVGAIYQVTQSGGTALYATVLDVIRAMNAVTNTPAELAERDRFAGYGLLVLDACHVRRNTRAEDDIITDIVDKRYREMRDTILISNQKAEEFFGSMSEDVKDRVIETGGKFICDWDGFRGAD